MGDFRGVASWIKRRVRLPSTSGFISGPFQLPRRDRKQVRGWRAHGISLREGQVILRTRGTFRSGNFGVPFGGRGRLRLTFGRGGIIGRVPGRAQDGADLWDRIICPETGGNVSSSGGSVITCGKLSGPVCLRGFSALKRTHARVTLRGTISKYSFKAGVSDAGAHLCEPILKSARKFLQANSRDAAVGPMLTGNLQTPILWNDWAKRTPSWPTNGRRRHSGSGAPTQICSQIYSHARVVELMPGPMAKGWRDPCGETANSEVCLKESK